MSGAGVLSWGNQRPLAPVSGRFRLCKQGVTGAIPVRSTFRKTRTVTSVAT
jgi:hypothetical protein